MARTRIPDLLSGYGPEDEDIIPAGLLDDEEEDLPAPAAPAVPALASVAPAPASPGRIPDLLSGYGAEDEDVIPAGLLDAKGEDGPELPAVGGVAPPPPMDEAWAPWVKGESPPPMVKAGPSGAPRPRKDTELANAQREDARSRSMGHASDALYSAFARRGLQNTGGGTDTAGELLRRRALEQGEADKTRKAGERIADRAALAKALGVDEEQLSGLSDEGLSKVLGVKVGERKATAATEAAAARTKAQLDAEVRKRQLELDDRKDERTWKEGRDDVDRTFRAGESEKDRKARIAAAEAAAGRRAEQAEERQTSKAESKDKASYLEGYELSPDAQPDPTEVRNMRAAQASTNSIAETIADIEALYKEHGTKVLPGPARAQMEAYVTDLQLAMKGPEQYALGVLAGPDMSLLEQTVARPTGTNASVLDFFAGDGNVLSRYEVLGKQAKRRLGNKARSLGYRPISMAAPSPSRPASRKTSMPKSGGDFNLSPGKVRVSNGKETFEVDVADLASAEAEGFKAVR